MSKVESIEQEVANLPPEELSEFRRWFAEFDATVWDIQLETDAAEGKLDSLAEEVLAEYRTGKAKEF